jgi:hypothetical protein
MMIDLYSNLEIDRNDILSIKNAVDQITKRLTFKTTTDFKTTYDIILTPGPYQYRRIDVVYFDIIKQQESLLECEVLYETTEAENTFFNKDKTLTCFHLYEEDISVGGTWVTEEQAITIERSWTED